MKLMNWLKLLAGLSVLAILTGCASPKPYDYTAFKQSRPRSILILPPVNSTNDVNASYGMLAQMTRPLAEAGYYVFPVALVDETFRQNGLTTASDIQAVAPAKLKEIFGADSALYVNVKKYGTSYRLIDSVTEVQAEAKLVDLKTGTVLWAGSAWASSNEGDNNNNGLIGALITAAVKQIVNSVRDRSFEIAGITSERMLAGGHKNGVLYGPYSPHYQQEGVQAP